VLGVPKLLMTSERSASVACEAVVATWENWSDTVCTAAPLATVVSAVTDVSTSTWGAPRKPASPPPAETEASVLARTSVRVWKYVCVDVARRDLRQRAEALAERRVHGHALLLGAHAPVAVELIDLDGLTRQQGGRVQQRPLLAADEPQTVLVGHAHRQLPPVGVAAGVEDTRLVKTGRSVVRRRALTRSQRAARGRCRPSLRR
jgi:hypothetical protein